MPLKLANNLTLDWEEIQITAIRASGPGGQNVNKVASAVQLRFDIAGSSLPQEYKRRLLAVSDRRITGAGVLIIKARQYRTYEKNREDALKRLASFIEQGSYKPKPRRPTKPSQGAKKKRLDAKNKRAKLKNLRKKVSQGD